MRHLTTSVRNWGPFWVHSGYQFEAWNKKLVENVKSANDRGSQIVNRFLLAKFLEDCLFDEEIAIEARQVMREHLQGARWDIPPLISTGQFFIGQDFIIIQNSTLEVTNLLRNAGIQINHPARLTRYQSALIHGTEYKVRDDKQTDYCNYFFRATTGFYTCEGIVTFLDVNRETVSGIIGSSLRSPQAMRGASHIHPYVATGVLRFIPFQNVISPAISAKFGRNRVIIPLANCYETD